MIEKIKYNIIGRIMKYKRLKIQDDIFSKCCIIDYLIGE